MAFAPDPVRRSSCVLLTVSLLGCVPGPAPEPAAEEEISASPNQALLDEAADSWFHAEKTRPIWARRVEEDQMVTTLEGEETVAAGDYLCRGEVGEMWPQKADKLEAKYEATAEVDKDGWRRYVPRPGAAGVMAAQVSRSFTVEATWGTLSGKPGDYLLKSYEDREVAYPQDVWIVDQALFAATYEPVPAAD